MISNWLPTSKTIHKKCKGGCDRLLPDTTEFFYTTKNKLSKNKPLRAVCKKCVSIIGNKKRQKALAITN